MTSNLQQPVTKQDLHDLEERMKNTTKQDLHDLEERMKNTTKQDLHDLEVRMKTTTKQDLHDLEVRMDKKFATKQDLKKLESKVDKINMKLSKKIGLVYEEIGNAENRLDKKIEEKDEKAREYRDQILTKMDEVMGELQNSREDRLIGEYQLKQRIEDHEARLKKIEHAKTPATQ